MAAEYPTTCFCRELFAFIRGSKTSPAFRFAFSNQAATGKGAVASRFHSQPIVAPWLGCDVSVFSRPIGTDNLQSLHNFLTTYAASRLTLAGMRPFRHIVTIVCIVASFIANAGEPLIAKGKGAANQPAAGELQLLQGTWQGVVVGDQSHEKITITITGNSFHFHRDTNFWFETTIALPPGTDPKQLHATIKGCPPSQADSIGKVVGAIFKIEDGTLTLATRGGSAEETPKSFEAPEDRGLTRYELRKVQPQKKNAQSPETK